MSTRKLVLTWKPNGRFALIKTGTFAPLALLLGLEINLPAPRQVEFDELDVDGQGIFSLAVSKGRPLRFFYAWNQTTNYKL